MRTDLSVEGIGGDANAQADCHRLFDVGFILHDKLNREGEGVADEGTGRSEHGRDVQGNSDVDKTAEAGG